MLFSSGCEASAGTGRGRRFCASAIVLALLTLAALACVGCDDQVMRTVRQGAFSVFQDGVNTFFNELGNEITTGITDLGSSSEPATVVPTPTPAPTTPTTAETGAGA
jgi:hypothetical protein